MKGDLRFFAAFLVHIKREHVDVDDRLTRPETSRLDKRTH